MKRLLSKKSRIIIIAVLAVFTVISIILSPFVNINYDMSSYLPKDSNTKVSIEVMQDEFGNVTMIQLMTTDINLLEAETIVDEINEIEIVKSVLWLGAVADISVPIGNMDQALIKDFYKDGKLLFTIEFADDDYSLVVGAAIEEIQSIVDDKNIEYYMRGSALGNKRSRDLVNSEMLMIFVIAVPAAILILFLVSTSWFEPVIILINLAVAIVINLGTNVLMPNVSYITMSIASILQLAMSLDYSLFIVHRYYEIRDEGLEPIEAAAQATKDAFKSVTASSFTTIFGFLALIIMRYKIGMDVGLSLTKAIAISYVVTLIFIPVLLISFDKILLKLKHKILLPDFSRITSRLNKGRIFITIFIFVVGGAAFYIQSQTDYFYSDNSGQDETSDLFVQAEIISEVFGPFEPIIVLYKIEDAADAIMLSDKLYEIPEVITIQSLITSVDPAIPEDILPPEALSQFKGKNYYRMIVLINKTTEDERSYELSSEIITLANETLTNGGYVIGVPIAITEIKEAVTVDGILVQVVSAIAVALVIGLILKNPITPIILVILIEISIWINISITYITGGVIAYIGYLVVSSLQLGATIDYAVLVSSRYQELRDPDDPKQSMVETMKKSAPAIITSASVLSVAGFVVVLVSSLGIVKEIGLLIGRGALLSGVLVLFILPALLLTFDKLIEKTNIKFRRPKKKQKIKSTNEDKTKKLKKPKVEKPKKEKTEKPKKQKVKKHKKPKNEKVKKPKKKEVQDMKKKRVKSLYKISLLVLFAFTLVGCKNNNNIEPTPSETPIPTTYTKVKKDEIIYVNMAQNGQIVSMKASNHITNSIFTNYEEYGKFLENGNLNISNSAAKIIIENDKAIIPSLTPQRNMFYSLTMDKNYYVNNLPFIIKPTYKLNDFVVGYQDLVNATGKIELSYEFISNPNSHQYYQKTFGAQVQIPINLKKAEIISAEGSMQTTIVGSEASLVYMIMPGANQTITIILDAIDFHFDGFQAVLQPIDIMSMVEEFIEIDQLINTDISSMGDDINLLVNELNDANDELEPLFKELFPMIPNFIEDNAEIVIDELQLLVDGLNDPQLDQAFTALTSVISYGISYQGQREWFQVKVAEIEQAIDNVTNYYNELELNINYLINNLTEIRSLTENYLNLYNEFLDVLEELDNIKSAVQVLEGFDDFNLDTIVDNKQLFINTFNILGNSSQIIKEKFQILIIGMFPLSNSFEFLGEAFSPLVGFFKELKTVQKGFVALAARIRTGLDSGWFSGLVSAQFETLYEELVKIDPDLENPGLIQGLDLALEAEDELGTLNMLEEAFKIDSNTNLSQIDQISIGFIQMNQALTLVQPGQELSFYDSLSMVQVVGDILELLPDKPIGLLPSFLSVENEVPDSLQFVIKQQGF